MQQTKTKRVIKWILILLVLPLLIYLLWKNRKKILLPRGLRNKNPGNIKISKDNPWEGEVPHSMNTDGTFEQFYEMQYGVRAMVRLLYGYSGRFKKMTLQEMIHRYAPPIENDTDDYVLKVVEDTGVLPDQPIAPIFKDRSLLKSLIVSMIHHENGRHLPDPKDIDRGIELAKIF